MAAKARLNVDDIGRVTRLLKIALVAVAVIAGLSAYMSTKGSYSSSASVAVIPPALDAQGKATNPIADIDYKTTQLALIAVGLADDPIVVKAAEAHGASLAGASTTVGDRSGASNLTSRIELTTTAPKSDDAASGLDAAVRALQIGFAQFQTRAGVTKPGQQARLVQLFRGDPVLANTSRLRAGAGTFLGVLLLGIVILTLINKPRPQDETTPDEPADDEPREFVTRAQRDVFVPTSRTRPTLAGQGTGAGGDRSTSSDG